MNASARHQRLFVMRLPTTSHLLCVFYAPAILSWPWFCCSTCPGLRTCSFLYLDCCFLCFLGPLSDFTYSTSSHTPVSPDEVTASIFCVLTIFLILYLPPVMQCIYLLICLPQWTMSFLRARTRFCSYLNKQHRLRDSNISLLN